MEREAMKTRHFAPALVFVALACSKEQPAPESPKSYEPTPADAPQDTDPMPQPPPPGEPQPSGPAGPAPGSTPMQKQGQDERLQHGGTGGMAGMGGLPGMGGMGGVGGTKSPIRSL
jgi:hypothetical protein